MMTLLDVFYQWQVVLLAALSLIPPVIYTVRTRAVWTRSRLGWLLFLYGACNAALFALGGARLATTDPDQFEQLTRLMMIPVSLLIVVNIGWIGVVWRFTGRNYRRKVAVVPVAVAQVIPPPDDLPEGEGARNDEH